MCVCDVCMCVCVCVCENVWTSIGQKQLKQPFFTGVTNLCICVCVCVCVSVCVCVCLQMYEQVLDNNS